MTTALPSRDEAPAWLPTAEVPLQRSAPLPPMPLAPVVPAPRTAVLPKPGRRWPAVAGGLVAGLAVGAAGAMSAISAVALDDTARFDPAPVAPSSVSPNVAVPGRVLSAFADGVWQVGVDIEPGTYTTAGAVGPTCYHATRTAMSGGDIVNSIIDPAPATVVLTEADGWFETAGCATWTRTG